MLSRLLRIRNPASGLDAGLAAREDLRPMTAPDRPVTVVFNPAAGRGRGREYADALRGHLEAAGVPVRLETTDPGRNVFAELPTEGLRAVVAIGGDGSLNEAVNGLNGADVPIGFGGTGTVNVATHELRLPDDPRALAGAILSGRTIRVPTLAVNGRRFLLFAEAGLLGAVVRDVNAWRSRSGKHGKLEFARYTLKHLPATWGRSLRVAIEGPDGSRVERRFSNVLVTRARLYGGTMPIPLSADREPGGPAPLERPDFEVVGYGSTTPLGHLALLTLANLRLLGPLRPLLQRSRWMEFHQGVRVRIEAGERADAIGVHADAETWAGPEALALPLEVVADGRSVSLIAG